LIHETSPYLLLHAHNPVDWYPWGDEAIEKARAEDKPIFLSVGYSTCYWCHVMEREVFSNPEIASLMNRWFINIKVDREERPDLDEIYMAATQLIQKSGGWPNSLFLTPQLEPFYAGTYFPPESSGGRPGFPTVLERLHQAWTTRREEVDRSAGSIAETMRKMIAAGREPSLEIPSREGVDKAVKSLLGRFDEDYGGFGGPPKFPSPANLYLLWHRAGEDQGQARRMVIETLHKMGQGAIYDQLAGGFHRYTLDEKWRIPHFEKMLYDNAHLAELLVVTSEATEDPELERLARETLGWVLQEMRLDQGGFKSAIDAETDGEEGAYYTWTAGELREVLGGKGFDWLAPIFGFDSAPNFEGEKYTLYLSGPLKDHAARLGVTRQDFLQSLSPHRATLLEARSKRKFPLVDDKVLTDWNSMMISALAKAATVMGEPHYQEAAQQAATFILENLRSKDGKLLHVWRQGKAKIPAFLDDYAFFIRALLTLYETTAEKRWLDEAERLTEELEGRLGDPNGGYFLSESRPHLLFRPKNVTDGAIPSGNGVALLNLLSLADHTGKAVYRRRAEAALRSFSEDLERYPQAVRTLALALDRYYENDAMATAPGTGQTKPPDPVAQLADKVVTATAVRTGADLVDGWRLFELTLRMQKGWHVNANPASQSYLIPTQIKSGARKVRYPKGEILRFDFSEEALAVYSGEATIRGEIDPEARHLILIYQPCDDSRCLPPTEKTVTLR
jgi:uncharacterized protein YyaL (SSP411 family)